MAKEEKEEIIQEKVADKPTQKSRKARQSNPTDEDFQNVRAKAKEEKKFMSLEELDAMPLEKYEDYLAYNEEVRKRRKALRKKEAEFLYCPLELVPCQKVRITRTTNKNLPIHLNFRKKDCAVWFQSPKDGFKHGEEVMLPECLIDDINHLEIPVYKQVVYPDGSHNTVLDYMDNKYACQTVMG